MENIDDDGSGQPNDLENEGADNEDENQDHFIVDDEEATKKRSPFWQHFSVIIDRAGIRYAKCKHCPT